MAEYTPSEVSVRAAFRLYGGGDTFPENTAGFDRFLARVRRDAAREALTRYESLLVGSAHSIGGYNLSAAVQLRNEAATVRAFRDREHPETEDQT